VISTKELERDALALFDARVPRRGDSWSRVMFEQGWIRDLFFFGGKQKFSLIGTQIVETPPQENEIQAKSNFIKPAVMRAVTKILSQQGRFGVAPESGSPRHREIARMSEQVMQHLRTATHYQREKFDALLWAATCGTSFLKNVFDPTAGEAERYYWFSQQDRTVLPTEFMSGEERLERDRTGLFDDHPAGEVSCEAVPSFQIHPDPVSKGKLEHCRWIAQLQWLPRAWVAERFGLASEDDLSADENGNAANRWDDALAFMSSSLQGQYFSQPANERARGTRTWFGQVWERPSRRHKKGRFMVVAGGKLLRDIDNPYVSDATGVCHIPFAKFDWMKMPGRFWGLSLVQDLVSPQYRYNESRSRTAEYEDIFARPVTVVPKNSGLAVSGFEIGNGKVYEYNVNGGKPEFLNPPIMPSAVSENSAACASEIRQLSSQSDVDASKMPGQLRSGLALNALQKERDIALNLTGFLTLEADRECGRQQLALARLFYDKPRLVAMRGSSGEWAVKQFQSADLRNDVRILGEPGEIETSEQFQSKLLEFVQVGALQPQTNPQHAQAVLKALKFHSAEEIVTDFTQHEERQEEENRRMIANAKAYLDRPYPVMPYEDDTAHQRVMERLFNNLDEWDKIDPQTQSVLVTHWEMHERQKMQKLAQQMQMIEATKGSPGQKGVASQPAMS
jgi:hypothetical protein